jgi:hypothetical protein
MLDQIMGDAGFTIWTTNIQFLPSGGPDALPSDARGSAILTFMIGDCLAEHGR